MKKNKLIRAPKVILFDWDNTLVDSFPLIAMVMNHTLVQFGRKPWTTEESHLYIQRSGRETMALHFGEQSEEATAFFYKEYEARNHSLCLLPGAYDLLTTLSNQNIKMGLVSNKNPRLMSAEAHHLNVSSFFKVCIGAGDADRDKPAPDPVLLALKRLEEEPGQDIWFVGDMPVDWICAEASGCFSVAIGESQPQLPESIGLSVKSCTELKKMLWIS